MGAVAIYAVLGVILIGICNTATIPNYIQICHRSDPNVSKCILESVESLRPKLKSGIPELDVPGLEPFKIKKIVVMRGGEGRHFNLELNDVDVFGVGDFDVQKLKLDVPNHTYRIQAHFPILRLLGTYSIDAKILSLPIKGSGKFEANGTNCEGTGILKGVIVQHNGMPTMHFTELPLDIHVEDYNLQLDGLFGGDKTLTAAVDQLVSQNKAEIMRVAMPVVSEKASEIILEIANKVTKNFNYEEVFPE